MTGQPTPDSADCTDTQVITRPRGAHRADPKPLFSLGMAAKASALGVLAVLTLAAPVVGTGSDDADAVAANATPVTTSVLDALEAGFAATAEQPPASDALVADPADHGRAEVQRASRVKVREPLPEEKEEAGKAAEAAVAEIAVAAPPAPEVVMPVASGDYRLTSQYGLRNNPMGRGVGQHLGVDFAAPLDTPIHAVADGEVTYVGEGKQGRSSMLITIKHEVDGKVFESWYVHMYPDDLYVSTGQQVQAGDVIAGVGSNGYSTGPHLHFEIHTDAGGSTTEPLSWMESLGAVDVGAL